MKNKSIIQTLRVCLLFIFVVTISGCSIKESDNEPEQTIENSIQVNIDTNNKLQLIRGFGGASIHSWINDLTEIQIKKAFSTTEGIGLSIMRVRIPTNNEDFSSEISQIQAARQLGVSIIATAWSAPANMKTNNNTVGGKLKPEAYASYAAYLRKYNSAVGGVMAISPWNEPNYAVPYESMNNNAAEIGNFLSSYGDSCGTKVIAPETFNMKKSFNDSVLAIAGSKLSAICGHIYGTTPSSNTTGKELWMTEHFTTTDSANIWSGAMVMAKEIHDCMVAGYNMYVWWYIRRFYGLIDDNSNITKRGYIMTHFARWIRPGYYRITCTENPYNNVYCTAYTNGSQVIIVAINQNTVKLNFCFNVAGSASGLGYTSFSTTNSGNLTQQSIQLSGSATLVILPASSITTMVSN